MERELSCRLVSIKRDQKPEADDFQWLLGPIVLVQTMRSLRRYDRRVHIATEAVAHGTWYLMERIRRKPYSWHDPYAQALPDMKIITLPESDILHCTTLAANALIISLLGPLSF